MDHNNIPSFALLRHGTVIVRVKMDVTSGCCGSQVPTKGYRRVVHRISSCEQCSRTRMNRYSDCDSGLVETCRPYRGSAARRRYVNVCAAVCLLLLVGGLTPQSSAAPHRNRIMDRTKRAADVENTTWANPCDYNDVNDMTNELKYTPLLAKQVALQASAALSKAKEYENKIVNLHRYQKFEDLYNTWKEHKFLRKVENAAWFRDEVLPEGKVYGGELDAKELDLLMTKIDEVLPAMYKALKVVVAGLFTIQDQVKNDNSIIDKSIQDDLLMTSHDVRSVLCSFSEVIRARKLDRLPLYDSEIPEIKFGDRAQNAFLIYRDAINYLEYLDQVFGKMEEAVKE